MVNAIDSVQCCVAGGGPAGMMLGLLLARAAVKVVVLEEHADFLRDFRSDTIRPSTLEVMQAEYTKARAYNASPPIGASAIRGAINSGSRFTEGRRGMRTARAPSACVVMTIVVALCLVAGGASLAAAQSGGSAVWKFAVFGDTRDAARDTRTGISPMLGRIAEGIAAEKPALVLHIGDLVNGYWVDRRSPLRGRYDEMFENWKSAVKPIYDFAGRTGIPLYVVRGNHEDGEILTDTGLKTAYARHIARLMPQNGPEKEKGLTYSVSHRGATFVAVDQYSERELGVVRGLVNQSWLDVELAGTDTPFTFVIGHVPAYRVSDAHAAPFPDLYDFPRHRDAFWSSLRRAGVLLYFCGHVHFYARVIANGIHQVVVGNGGADFVDFDPGKIDRAVSLEFPQRGVKAADMKVGYVILTVDETAGTVEAVQRLWNAASGRWEVGDTFTVSARRTSRR